MILQRHRGTEAAIDICPIPSYTNFKLSDPTARAQHFNNSYRTELMKYQLQKQEQQLLDTKAEIENTITNSNQEIKNENTRTTIQSPL